MRPNRMLCPRKIGIEIVTTQPLFEGKRDFDLYSVQSSEGEISPRFSQFDALHHQIEGRNDS